MLFFIIIMNTHVSVYLSYNIISDVFLFMLVLGCMFQLHYGGKMFEFTVEEYDLGIKRLMTIVKRSKKSKTQVGNKVSESSFQIKKNVCVVCGYFWDANQCKDDEPKKCPACRSSLWNCMDLYRHTCKCCLYKWASKTKNPVMCPKCKSTLWDEDVKRYECQNCGYVQDYKMDKNIPESCPKCDSEQWTCNSIGCTCKKCGYVGRLSVNRTGRCPLCKTTLSINPQIFDSRSMEIDSKTRSSFVSNEGVENILHSDIEDTKKAAMLVNEQNIDYCDAEIMIRCFRGESAFNIARSMDLTFDKVMKVVSVVRVSQQFKVKGVILNETCRHA
jgi:predicted Zn-ribbon and HTH transcriptional regulator